MHGDGKTVFRCQAVVQRHHSAVAKAAQLPAQHIMRGQTADGEATAMQVQQHGQFFRCLRFRRIQTRGHGMTVTGRNDEVFNPVHRRRGQVQHRATDVVKGAGLFGGHHVHGRAARALYALDQVACSSVQQRARVGVVTAHEKWVRRGAEGCCQKEVLPT